jgi:CO/xanthine dehydrogenase FAD-binding subunit
VNGGNRHLLERLYIEKGKHMKNFIGSRAMPDLIYHSPEDMDGLMSLLQNNTKNGQQKVKIVAGCTDFVPAVRTGRWDFKPGINIIDIKKIKSLNYIKKEDNQLKIGACTRLVQIFESLDILENAKVLSQAVGQMASLQVRNTATIGGNLCMSSPAADSAPVLLVLDAKVTLQDPKGAQEIWLKDFFTGPGQNVLKSDQILTQISFPIQEGHEAAHFLKIGTRTAVIIAVVSTAVGMGIKNGVCENPKIALGSVAPTPIRVEKAEKFLHHKFLDDQTIEACAKIVSEEITPITDLRAGKEYRKDMASTLVKRAILACRKEKK